MPYDTIIIGGGSSGMAAANYLARHRWHVLVIDGSCSHNQHGNHNPPCDDMDKTREEFESLGGIFQESNVKKLSSSTKSRQVSTTSGDTFLARTVIIASGISLNGSLSSGEKKFLGKGLYYDYESANFAGKTGAAIIGKSVEAARSAIRLADILANAVFVIPASRIDVGDELWQKIKQRRSKLKLLFSASLKDVRGEDHVEKITVFSQGKEEIIESEAVLLYSHEFNSQTSFVPPSVQIAEKNKPMVDENLSTSSPGIFAAGDVLCAHPQMPTISTAQGILAGKSAERFLWEE